MLIKGGHFELSKRFGKEDQSLWSLIFQYSLAKSHPENEYVIEVKTCLKLYKNKSLKNFRKTIINLNLNVGFDIKINDRLVSGNAPVLSFIRCDKNELRYGYTDTFRALLVYNKLQSLLTSNGFEYLDLMHPPSDPPLFF